MTNATALTRQGKLKEATLAIQEALSKSPSRSQTIPDSGIHKALPFALTAGRRPVDKNTSEQVTAPAQEYVPKRHVTEEISYASQQHGARQADREHDPKTGFLAGEFTHEGLSIPYRLFIPTVVAQRPMPLLVLLHGCTQDATDFATGTAMNAIAQEKGIAVLYPSQTARSNVNKCWNWFEPAHQRRGAGEPAALSALTRQICSSYACNPKQVFVAGMSAGGAMAVVLGEQYPELYSAVGVHSGLPSGVASNVMQAMSAMNGGSDSMVRPPHTAPIQLRDATAPSRVQPFIIFHGDQDATVSSANAQGIIENCLMRAEDLAGPFVSKSLPAAGGGTATVTTYSNSEQEIVCEYWRIHAAGHRWSGGNPAGSHTDATGPNASAEMIRFFLQTVKASAV